MVNILLVENERVDMMSHNQLNTSLYIVTNGIEALDVPWGDDSTPTSM